METVSLDAPSVGGCLPCASKKSGCGCSGGSCSGSSGRSCAAQGMRFRTRVFSAEYITARVLRAVEKLNIPGLRASNIEAQGASFSNLCFSRSLRGVSGASFQMYAPGANSNSEPFFSVTQSGGVDVIGDVDATGRLNVGGGAGPTGFSVSEQGTVTSGFAAAINNNDSSPASFLVANEGDAAQQLVLATQYVGGVPPSSQQVGNGTMDAGSAFVLRVDADTSESVTLAPYNAAARQGLSYTQELYEPDELPPQPGSQGRHVFVGDMSVVAPGLPPGSAPVFDIEHNQINMTGDVLINGKPVVFDYVFPWQETLASGASTFHGPVQQLAERSDGGYTRTLLGNRSSGGGAELVLAAGYTPAPKRMARFSESDDLSGNVDAAYALRVSAAAASSGSTTTPPSLSGGSPDAQSFQIAYVGGGPVSGGGHAPGYELRGAAANGAGAHVMRGASLAIEEVGSGAAAEPVLVAASKGTDARGPIRIRESLPDAQALGESAPIIERDGTSGSLVIGYETGATAGDRADGLTVRPTADTSGSRAFVKLDAKTGDDAAVEIGPKFKVGALTIETVKDPETNEDTVQFLFNDVPLMIFKNDVIQITKGLQAAELHSGGGSGGSGAEPGRTGVSFGGVQFASVPIIDDFDENTADGFQSGGAFIDGNGYMRIAYAQGAESKTVEM